MMWLGLAGAEACCQPKPSGVPAVCWALQGASREEMYCGESGIGRVGDAGMQGWQQEGRPPWADEMSR